MLGLQVIVVRRSAQPAGPGVEAVAFEDLNRVLPRADWLVLACPLSDRTRQLINRDSFAAIKPGARLVNVARGEVVDEPDLVAALQSGVLQGAPLDVFQHEPLDRSEEHTSALQSLMRTSYAVLCLKKKNTT